MTIMKEDLDFALEEIKRYLRNSNTISRPYEYEHNHFMLTEKIANYIILKEEKDKQMCNMLNSENIKHDY